MCLFLSLVGRIYLALTGTNLSFPILVPYSLFSQSHIPDTVQYPFPNCFLVNFLFNIFLPISFSHSLFTQFTFTTSLCKSFFQNPPSKSLFKIVFFPTLSDSCPVNLYYFTVYIFSISHMHFNLINLSLPISPYTICFLISRSHSLFPIPNSF